MQMYYLVTRLTDTYKHLYMPRLKTINRSVLIIMPKQPYYDWGNQIFEAPLIDSFSECWSCLLDDEWDVTETWPQ